jgi:hypothetical protein
MSKRNQNRHQNQNVAAQVEENQVEQEQEQEVIENQIENPPEEPKVEEAPAEAPAPPKVEVLRVDGLTRDEYLANCGGVKSTAIRKLHAAGYKVGPIAKFLSIKYQHARNVLIQPLGAKVPVVTVAQPAVEQTEEESAAA